MRAANQTQRGWFSKRRAKVLVDGELKEYVPTLTVMDAPEPQPRYVTANGNTWGFVWENGRILEAVKSEHAYGNQGDKR